MSAGEQILTKLGDLNDKLVRLEAKAELKDETKPKSWVELITAFALMIGAVLGIYTIVLGWGKDTIEIDQGPFKVQEAQLQVQKLELEIEEKLRALNQADPEGLLGNAEETRDLLSEIQGTLADLSETQSSFEIGHLIVPFIFIWAFFRLIGIAENTVTTFWSYVIFGVHFGFRAILSRIRNVSKLGAFLVRLFEVGVVQLPSLFFLFLRVLLFGAVVIPFLYQVAAFSPVQEGLQTAVEAVLNYRPFEAIDALSVLFQGRENVTAR